MTRTDTDHSSIKILSVLSVAKHKFRIGRVLENIQPEMMTGMESVC